MWVIVLVLVLVLSLLSLSYSTDHVEFAVVLTTIPSRFAWLEPTLSSWLKQDISPSVILIFVPKTYARFRSKSDLVASGEHQSYATWLEFKLSVDFQRELREKTISVLETAMDWGPATKFVGLLEHLEPIRNQYKAVTHWVVGDDDVAYAKGTLAKYRFSLSWHLGDLASSSGNEARESQRAILTHFSHDSRLRIKLSTEPSGRHITHIQGVDTLAIPAAILYEQADLSGPLCFERMVVFLTFLFRRCPATFYQDDYVISLAFDIAEVQGSSLTCVSKSIDVGPLLNFPRILCA